MTPCDVLRGAPALCDPREPRPRPAPGQRVSYSPCFHPTQATPQETHTREISWLLFIHEKTQKPTSKPYKHPPVQCGLLSLAVLSFFLAGWASERRLCVLGAASRAPGVQRVQGSDTERCKVATPRRKLSVKGGTLSTEQSAGRCRLALPAGWGGVGRSWFPGEKCGRSPSWVCRCFC